MDGTGFLLLYKRFEDGRLSWPRTTQEAAELTEEQFHYLMLGLNPLEPRIKERRTTQNFLMIVQNREIFLLFFTYIFVPGGHILMLHEGNRNGIYAFQNTKNEP